MARTDDMGGAPALGAAYRSIVLPKGGSQFRRFMTFFGPGYLVATGYMDPGNWATSLAAGSKLGMSLLWVTVLSSLMAVVLQGLSARLAIATGRDLAQICRDRLPRPVTFLLWIIMEGAIIATDLAEVIGTAIGLELLFGIPLMIGICITALDALLVLAFTRLGFRKLEAFVGALLVLIAACFAIELLLAKPDIHDMIDGLLPKASFFGNPDALYLAIGIIGATVMPHNLFLHSGIIGTRDVGNSDDERRAAIRYALIDSAIALLFAMLINGAILILSAAAFNAHGHTDIVELGDAYKLIAPLVGTALAAKLFAIGLIACGLNSTLTATLAGQIVMEGFVRLRVSPILRRAVTRGLALVPALGVIIYAGSEATGQLLIGSQVVLSLALPFAMVPLIWFSGSRRLLGKFAPARLTTIGAAVIAALIIAFNAKVVFDAFAGS
jgi:manganese transport protein